MPSYEEVSQRAGSLRAMTGLTEQECTALLPLFEDALGAYLRDRTIDGQPRTSRRYSPYDNCPLPTMARYGHDSPLCSAAHNADYVQFRIM